jgi:hypothetical protein
MTDLRRSAHLAVLAGLSAGAYSGSLAVVAWLQSASDSALVAERAPIGAAADAISASHDALDADVAAAIRRFGAMSDRYRAFLPQLADVETSLDALAKTASSVTHSTLTVPTRLALPAVQSAPRVVRVAAPTTQATTGASGR